MLYNLSAREVYNKLEETRSPYLQRAYKCASVTLPRIMPTNHSAGKAYDTSYNQFDTPKNSVSTKGVNSLSNRLLSTLLPASDTFFKLSIPEDLMKRALEINENAGAEIESSLRQIENTIYGVVSSKSYRSTISEAFKNLIITGNCLLHYTREGNLSLIPLTSYVVARDGNDEVQCIVIKQVKNINTLSEDIISLLSTEKTSNSRCEVEIYTKIIRVDEDTYEVHQELCEGVPIPDTYKKYDIEEMPFILLRWSKVDTEDYGRSLVEEVLGELVNLESFESSLADAVVASARLIGFISPTGVTHPQDLNQAANGEFIRGDMRDVSFLQVGKTADLSLAMSKIQNIERRIEQVFLLNSTLLSDSKNVTATALKMAAEELESSLGGVYSLFSNSFQLPLVRLILQDLEKQELTPALPKDLQISITTGLTALGRAESLQKLQMAFGLAAGVLGPQALQQYTNVGNIIKFILDNSGITQYQGLVKTDKQIADEQAQAQQQQAMLAMQQKFGGASIDAMSKAATNPMEQMMKQMVPQDTEQG